MFWRVPSYSQASPLEGILDKQKFTLEELLDEEDLIQECKALNGRLLNFLLQPDSIEQLITYFTVQSPLPPGLDEAEVQKRWSKFPFAACEVFCCEVDAIFNTLFGSEYLMAKLFSIVGTDKLPDITLSGYFARVIKVLLVKRNQDMMDYLYNHQQTLSHLANHLETTSMAEVMVFVVGAAEFSSNYATSDSLNWLKQTNLTQEILNQMRSGNAKDGQKNAAAVLAAIARSQISPLLSNMSNSSFLGQLTEYAFTSDAQVSCQALDVCIALLLPKQALSNTYSSPGDAGVPSPPTSPPADNEADRHLKDVTIDSISAYISNISDSLDVPDSGKVLETPFGMLKPPLGSLRLKLVELLSAMLRLGNSTAEESIISVGAAQKALSLLLQFPFNNLLHTQVTSLILHALDTGTPAIVEHLFDTCKLLRWLTQAPEKVQPAPREGDKKASDRQPIRAGYLGHLVLLGNSLLEASSRRTDIRTALQASPDWQKYVQGSLAEANNRQDVMQWACGRPSKETLSTFKSTDDIMIDETDAPEEGSVNRHLMRYHSFEDDDGDVSLPADKDFSEAADALGSLNLSEGWSSLSLRSRHSESGAQDAELRAQRGDPFEENRSHQEAGQEEEEDQYGSAQSEDSGIDDDVLVMTEDYDDLMDEDVVVIAGAHKSDHRAHGNSSWAVFDDLATERSSRLNSAESAQRPESESSPSAQEQRPSNGLSDSGGGWAAFRSDSPAFPSNDSTFQKESAASGGNPSSRQSHQESKQPSGSDAQSPPSASWAAFEEPELSLADSTSVGSSQQGQRDTSVVDNSQHSKPNSASASQQADEKPLPNPTFGESNYWRTHPLDLVDIVD
ncbi:hypothetical protein WJX77_008919 [Trebouxia sp. C0004]